MLGSRALQQMFALLETGCLLDLSMEHATQRRSLELDLVALLQGPAVCGSSGVFVGRDTWGLSLAATGVLLPEGRWEAAEVVTARQAQLHIYMALKAGGPDSQGPVGGGAGQAWATARTEAC